MIKAFPMGVKALTSLNRRGRKLLGTSNIRLIVKFAALVVSCFQRVVNYAQPPFTCLLAKSCERSPLPETSGIESEQ